MSDNLSKPNNEDEQNIQDGADDTNLEAMFAAAYSGDDAESSRLMSEAAEDEGSQETTPQEEEVDSADSINIASTDLTDSNPSEPTPTESTDEMAELRNELHRAKSDAGRVPYLNRRVQELERQLLARAAPADKPDATALPDKLKERIDSLRAIDPDLADLIEESHNSNAAVAKQTAAAYNEYVKMQQAKEDEEYTRTEYNKVVASVPEAGDVFRSKEWGTWVGMLSPNHRALAESSDASEVLTALQAFRVDAERLFGGYKWGTSTTSSTPPQPSATAIAAETSRASRLASSANVKPTAARATTEPDLEALFKAAYENEIASSRIS